MDKCGKPAGAQAWDSREEGSSVVVDALPGETPRAVGQVGGRKGKMRLSTYAPPGKGKGKGAAVSGGEIATFEGFYLKKPAIFGWRIGCFPSKAGAKRGLGSFRRQERPLLGHVLDAAHRASAHDRAQERLRDGASLAVVGPFGT